MMWYNLYPLGQKLWNSLHIRTKWRNLLAYSEMTKNLNECDSAQITGRGRYSWIQVAENYLSFTHLIIHNMGVWFSGLKWFLLEGEKLGKWELFAIVIFFLFFYERGWSLTTPPLTTSIIPSSFDASHPFDLCFLFNSNSRPRCQSKFVLNNVDKTETNWVLTHLHKRHAGTWTILSN